VPIGLGPLRPYAGGGVGFGRLDLDIEDSFDASVFDDEDYKSHNFLVGVRFGF
jgi:opacity protein-like surface antigen